jgi:TfuA protein
MSNNGDGVFVFAGPSLHPAEGASILDAVFLPPIKRGDLERFRKTKPRAIAIIDGEFFQTLAIAPKEILALLESGVPIHGAASMGALRAVELERYGMRGAGSVFRLFRRGVLDADDEVAQVYCPETYRGLSEPLVNTRYALRRAVRHALISAADAAILIDQTKRAYFPDRTRQFLLFSAQRLLGVDRTRALQEFLSADRFNIKNHDARLLLSQLAGVDHG